MIGLEFNPSGASFSGQAIMSADLPPTESPQPGTTPPRLTSENAQTVVADPSSGSGGSKGGSTDLQGVNITSVAADRYRLIRVLGKGGFGTVYLAHDRILDQNVAIKVLTLSGATENETKRFIFEARTSAKLRHPGIVNIFDITQDEGKLQLVMEFYPGGSLSQFIKDQGPLPPLQALGWARQVAAGLAFAHKNGIIHRDIKPANIFLAGDGIVKLGDFGIAAHTATHEHTRTGEVMGSPLYMSPEQTRDSKNIDGRSDLYSLGLTLYHMLSGKPPTAMDLDTVHPLLKPLLRTVTAYEIEERPQTAEAMIAMIDQTMATLNAAGMGNMAFGGMGTPAGPYIFAPSTSGGAGSLTPTASMPLGTHPGTLGPTATAPTPRGAGFYPPGYAGSEDPTLTQQPVVAPAGYGVIVWSIVALVVVVLAGFVTIIHMIQQKQTASASAEVASALPPVATAVPAVVVAPTPQKETEQEKIREAMETLREARKAGELPMPKADKILGRPKEKEREKEAGAESKKPVEGDGAASSDSPDEKMEKGGTTPLRDRPRIFPGMLRKPPPPPIQPPPAATETPAPPPSVDDAQKMLSAGTDSAKTAYERGMNLHQQWQKDKNPEQIFMLKMAAENFATAIQENPKDPMNYYQLGLTCEDSGKSLKTLGKLKEATEAMKNAFHAFEKVIELDPDLKTPGVADTIEHLNRLRVAAELRQGLRNRAEGK